MNKLISGLVMIVIVSGALWSWRRRTKERSFGSVEDMMQYLTGEAVGMAREDHGTVLDYSDKSVMDVEKILGALHEEYRSSRSETGVKGLAMAYGAYIGEVIRRRTPGSIWERNHPVVGEKSYPLLVSGGALFPCGWCYQRIINGAEDNVWHKYALSTQQRELEIGSRG
jgi:hypothetical protein